MPNMDIEARRASVPDFAIDSELDEIEDVSDDDELIPSPLEELDSEELVLP